MAKDPVKLQRDYYSKTAAAYDSIHLDEKNEHYFALAVMTGLVKFAQVNSILDVGAGTGRAVAHLTNEFPQARIIGVEPSGPLREIASKKGIANIQDGDGSNLPFKDGEFDLVCAFGVLHHVAKPSDVVEEMLRVSKKGIFISDSNNFGQGSSTVRGLKQMLNTLGLWPLANFLKTRGKGYIETEGDGISYSYSLFNNLDLIRSRTRRTHHMNTLPSGTNLYLSAGHACLFALK